MAWKGIKKFFRSDIEVRCEYCTHSSDFDGACVCQLGKYRTPEGFGFPHHACFLDHLE